MNEVNKKEKRGSRGTRGHTARQFPQKEGKPRRGGKPRCTSRKSEAQMRKKKRRVVGWSLTEKEPGQSGAG